MRRARTARTALATMVALTLFLGVSPASALAPGATPAESSAPVAASVARPTIVTQPVRDYVLRGENATFRVVAKGSGLKYQWYRNYQPYAQGLSGGGASYKPKWRPISGATRPSYTVKGAMRLHSSRFRVVVSNAAGSVTSSAVTLLVGTRYLTGPHMTPTRPSSKPFQPREVAFLKEWAVSLQPTRRVKASDTADRVTVEVAAYSGYITSWLYNWVKTKPTSTLSVGITAVKPDPLDSDDRVYRARLSGLEGAWDRGFTFTATVTVPRGWDLSSWEITREDFLWPQYFSSKTG